MAAAVVGILALVMTAGATLFSLTNAIVFRSLPVPEADRLVSLSLTDTQAGGMRLFPYDTYRRFADDQQVFESVFGYRGSGVLDLQFGDTLARGTIAAATPEIFAALGLTPAIGRFYTAVDAPRHGEPAHVVVLGHRLWQRMFGGDPDVIGQPLVVRGTPLTMIGVMPASFDGLEPDVGNDFYIPLTLLSRVLGAADAAAPNPRTSHLVGRLRGDMTIERARAAASTIWPAIYQETQPAGPGGAPGDALADNELVVESAAGGFSPLRNRLGRQLQLLTGLAIALVMVGYVNLGGLVHARSMARAGQFAVLLALGAPRRRVGRVLVLESLMLSMTAAAIALSATWVVSEAAGAMVSGGTPQLLTSMTPDWRVVAGMTVAALLAVVVIGVMPMLSSIRTNPGLALQRRGATPITRRAGAFVVLQVALSIVLLASAGLFVTSLHRLRAIDSGFRQSDLVFGRAWQLPGPTRSYDEQAHYPELVARLEALPGVEAVAMSHYFPGYLNFVGLDLERVARVDASDRESDVRGLLEFISPRFFETAGTHIVRGRDFTWSDRIGASEVVIINESLERQLFPDGGAIGARIRVGTAALRQSLEIVGVSADVTVGNLRSPRLPTAFRPRAQEPDRQRVPILLLRTRQDAAGLLAPVNTAVRAMGHEHVRALQTIEEQLDATVHQERLLATASVVFGAVAAVVTFIGLYALVAHTVVARTREIGVRVAIGASSARIVRLVVRQALVLTTVGIVCGVPGALMVGRLAESLLYGVDPADPRVIAASAIVFVLIALAAALVPARRAARVDPVVALRAE